MAIVIENLSLFLFCGFLALFIMPQIFFRLFYHIPHVIYFSAKKKMLIRAVLTPLREFLAWFATVAALYLAAFLIDRNIGYSLISSPMAVFCWLLGLFELIVIFVVQKRRREWQDAFYRGLYLRFATPRERERYDEFIAKVEAMAPAEAHSLLTKGHWSYLEKRALGEKASLAQARTGGSRIDRYH